MNALVGSAAFATATAIPSNANACSYPDLLARYEALYSRWCAKMTEDRDRMDHFEVIYARHSGMPVGWRPKGPFGDEDEKIFNQAQAEHLAAMPDDDPDNKRWEELNDDLEDLLLDVLSRPATTLADAALNLQMYALWFNERWLCPFDADEHTQAMFANVASVCGASILPGLSDRFRKPREYGQVDETDRKET